MNNPCHEICAEREKKKPTLVKAVMAIDCAAVIVGICVADYESERVSSSIQLSK